MLPTATHSRKKINLDRFIFIERYAPTLIKWDILAFFAAHPDISVSALDLSQHLNRNYQVVRRNTGDLALLGILDVIDSSPHPVYRLTEQTPRLRDLVQRVVLQTPQPFDSRTW